MLPLRYGHYLLWAGLLALAAGLGVALQRQSDLLPLFVLSDKLYHAVAFALFAIWFGGLVQLRRLWVVAAGLLAYGALVEVAQSFTSYRRADGFDLAADALGILVGLLLSAAGLRHWGRLVESWLVDRPR
jgi:VanZ family protein